MTLIWLHIKLAVLEIELSLHPLYALRPFVSSKNIAQTYYSFHTKAIKSVYIQVFKRRNTM